MIFDYKYLGQSNVHSSASASDISFIPDFSRPQTFFRGVLHPKRAVLFREAISALHAVVVDEQRYQAPDNSAYLAWRKEHDQKEFQQLLAKELGISVDDANALKVGNQASVTQQMAVLNKELDKLRSERAVLSPKLESVIYNRAVARFYARLYHVNRDLWEHIRRIYDPVITVHPENMFFECFSQDESSYGKLSCNYNIFSSVDEFECGTTNIDYSSALYNEFQKIRSYKKTTFEVDPEGFNVNTEYEDNYREVKIDLPETWVRGFLQVSAAMEMDAQKVRLSPFDLHKICLFLRKNKEIVGPRALRFQLSPDAPPKVVFEPWNHTYICSSSSYMGSERREVRVWGRRRIHILERLIPIAQHFDLYLIGKGLPYFFIANLGELSFTLGLSGWTSNNFSGSAQFDLLAPRKEVSDKVKQKIFKKLRSNWTASVSELAKSLSIDKSTVASVLTSYVQAGRVVYDLEKNCYQARELSRDPLDMKALRFGSPQEEEALELLAQERVGILQETVENRTTVAQTKVDSSLIPEELKLIFQQDRAKEEKIIHVVAPIETVNGVVQTQLVMNEDGRMLLSECSCTCSAFNTATPCSHLLALRVQYNRPEEIRKVASITFSAAQTKNSAAQKEKLTLPDQTLQELYEGVKPPKKAVKKASSKASVKKSKSKKAVAKETARPEEVAPKAAKKKAAKKKATNKKATTKRSASLSVLKSMMNYDALKKGILDKQRSTDALEEIVEYKGTTSYKSMIELMLEGGELKHSSSSKKYLKAELRTCQVEDSADPEEDYLEDEYSEEDDEASAEFDLSEASVIFVGRFPGFTQSKLKKAAKNVGVSIASTISKATIVVEGTNIGTGQKKQLKSFDGETIDIETWTERISGAE